MIYLTYVKMHRFKSYLVDPDNNRLLDATMFQQIQENAICIGETGYFQIDYAFISQVTRYSKYSIKNSKTLVFQNVLRN